MIQVKIVRRGATLSYHMSRLTALNPVTYERGERKRVYYCVKKDIVYRMLKTFEKDIFGKLYQILF